MNLILLTDGDFTSPGLVRLYARRHQHIRDILGASTGQSLRVGLLGGPIGTARVLAMQGEFVDLQVSLDASPPAPLQATLILALPRPKVLRRVLQNVTALGVKKIVLLNTWRVDKSYWQSPLLTEEAMREQLLLGLEQAGDTILPEIRLAPRFKPFIEDSLPTIVAGTRAMVAHPVGGEACPANLSGPFTLAIGPEGGFTPYEIGRLAATGFEPIHLGSRPLRVESAVSALLGRIMPCLC